MGLIYNRISLKFQNKKSNKGKIMTGKKLSKQKLDSLVNEIRREMQGHFVPPKRKTKLPGKVTPNSFNQNLRGVPGNSRARGIVGIMLMADASETGTLLATEATKSRLKFSSQHCDTTRSNYLV
jgi:hypothetical protein